MAVDTASYAMEIQGGNGYVDDFVTNRLLRDAQVLPIWEGTANVLSLDFLRTLEREATHEALVPLVQRNLDAVDHPALASLVETVAGEFERVQEAVLSLATESEAYAQHEAKRLADYVFDVVTASLLLASAQRELDAEDDARKAVVAEWFVRETLETRDARGITDGDALPMDHFDAVVRHAPLDPPALEDR